MKGRGYRPWYLAAGVAAVGILAFGWTALRAPASDANSPKPSRTWELSEQGRKQVLEDTQEFYQTQGSLKRVKEDLQRQTALLHAPTEREKLPTEAFNERPIEITRVEATPFAGGSGLATGGATPNGGACTCDSDCAAAVGQCKVAHCVVGICVQSNTPVDTPCDNDGLDCTEERCSDTGVCENTSVGFLNPGIRISACSKQCCLTAACGPGSSKINCFEGSNCTGGSESCFPKIQAGPGGTYQAKCDESGPDFLHPFCYTDTVALPGLVNAVGRCCTVAGACSITTAANCASGMWIRMRDPDDVLHVCNATDGCPKYGSGIAPDGAHITGVGKVVPPASRCSIVTVVGEPGSLCENAADCITRCNGGTKANESCDIDIDCPGGGLCQNLSTCVAASGECTGAGTFTSIGDDYVLSNNSYMRLSEFRFRGGGREPEERVMFEFYDNTIPATPKLVNTFTTVLGTPGDFDYRIIVDCYPNCDASQPADTFGEESRLDPPFIIPPNGIVVMKATRLGATLSAVTRQYGEDDGNLFWYSTDNAGGLNVGTNDPNLMWVNGAMVNHSTAVDTLSFELVGTKIPAPLAACCNPTTGACADTLQWNCAFCTSDNVHGTPCQRGRDCGLNNQYQCSTRDWKGARTANQVIGNAYRLCANRYCFDPLLPNPNTLTACTGTGQGTCPDDGNPNTPALICEQPCETAACCTPSGCIQVANVAACTAASGTILAFGQKCTPNCCPKPNTGVDCCKDFYSCHTGGGPFVDTGNPCNFVCSNNATRQCTEDYECDSPGTCTVLPNTQANCLGGQTCRLVCDGPDSVADPRIHSIDVPTYNDGSEQVTVDFQGITSGSVFADDCTLGGPDKGWYEIFTIGKADPTDTCAKVVVNLCCSDPIVTPVQTVANLGCPCIGSETVFPDTDSAGQNMAGFGSTCRNAFCCTDGNFSVQWTLPVGSYIYQIAAGKSCSFSTDGCELDGDCDPGVYCRKENTSYKGHIIAKPCAPGACCGLPEEAAGLFCDTVDKFTCENHKYCKHDHTVPCTTNANCGVGGQCLEGVFLGDKTLNPVGDCQGGATVCGLGACCGPQVGACSDNGGSGITHDACENQNGTYIGGFRCSENPCPVCPIDTADQCQSYAYATFIMPNDRLIGIRRADDFRPAGNLISRICWWPCYLGVTETSNFECNTDALRPPYDYILKIYQDDGTGKPGALIPGIPGAGLLLTVDADENASGLGGGSRCQELTAAVGPLSVTAGGCYWIEITGSGEVQGNGTCVIHWVSTGDGNNYSLRDTNNVYELGDIEERDLAFCVDSGLAESSSPPVSQDAGCGQLLSACCRRTSPTASTCTDGGTHTQCWGTNQTSLQGIPYPFQTCAQIGGNAACPYPENDDCANAEMPAACMNQVANPNLGVCSVSAGPPSVDEVCDTSIGTAPRHDCVNAAAICGSAPANSDVYRCQFTTDNRLATTDGPGATFGGCGLADQQSDVWYKYTAPCNGYMVIDSCGSYNTYDSTLQVFGSAVSDPNVCTACPITGITAARACSDDNCGTSSGGSTIRIDVLANNCYMLRYGGYSQLAQNADAAEAVSGLDIGVVCNPPVTGNNPVAVQRCGVSGIPTGNGALCGTVGAAACPGGQTCGEDAGEGNGDSCRKNRYISFQPNNAGNANVAFRVDKSAVPAGVYYPGGSPAGTCWVQAPNSVAAPFWPTAVSVSQCGTTAVFRDWTEGVIHLGDCEMIPVANYTIFTVTNPGGIVIPGGLAISTIAGPTGNSKLWGDASGPFNGSFWPCPDGFTNVSDLLALTKYLEGPGNVTRAHATRVNVTAANAGDTCLPSQVNTGDVQGMVAGIQTKTFSSPDFPTRPNSIAGCTAACPTP